MPPMIAKPMAQEVAIFLNSATSGFSQTCKKRWLSAVNLLSPATPSSISLSMPRIYDCFIKFMWPVSNNTLFADPYFLRSYWIACNQTDQSNRYMNHKEKVQQLMQEAQRLRKASKTSSPSLENYLLFQQITIANKKSCWICGASSSMRQKVNKSVQRAFEALSHLQQAELYLLNVRSLSSFVSETSPSQKQKGGRYERMIQIGIKGEETGGKWTEVKAKVMEAEKIIDAVDMRIDLHDYFIRKSHNKNKISIALENTKDHEGSTVRIGFKNDDFEELLNYLHQLWALAQEELVHSMLREDQLSSKQIKTEREGTSSIRNEPLFSGLRKETDQRQAEDSEQSMPKLELFKGNFEPYQNQPKNASKNNNFHRQQSAKTSKLKGGMFPILENNEEFASEPGTAMGSQRNNHTFNTDDFQRNAIRELRADDNISEEQFLTAEGSYNCELTLEPAEGESDEEEKVLPILDFSKNIKSSKVKVYVPESEIESQPVFQNKNRTDSQIYRHPTSPLSKQSPLYLSSEKGHWLWGTDWKSTEEGEFINTNEEKIKTQSGALKLIVKRMGRNLLAGKSIINVSLPIEILGTDSNLERICKGYIYAPLLLERVCQLDHPVDRLKYCFCFGLTFSITYIEMQKPFNPILGETYQALIDNCPVSAEQVSHHPPVSNTFMVGRGYRIHGSFEAKVSLGLNSASGINDGFNFIIFEDGRSSMKFNTPAGEMSGIIYGERKLSLVKNSYYHDEVNRLFCEVKWGRNKKSPNLIGKRNDYFQGKICKLKVGANTKDLHKIKSSDIEDQYGLIYGTFTGKVFFEGEELFDVETFLPFKMIDYEQCLDSDSRFREDIILRKKLEMERAHEAKQRLEDAQRKDRKLREKYAKK